jgi:hypothetical protein
MRQLQGGLWHWQPSEPWDQAVSSYAIDDDDRVLLFDSLAVPSEIEKPARLTDPRSSARSPELRVRMSRFRSSTSSAIRAASQ